MSNAKANFYFILSLVLAIWFALTSFIWVYLANMVISLPAAYISMRLWKKGKDIDNKPKRYKIINVILVIGFILLLISLPYFLINDLIYGH
jgi:hypothetical protein